MTEVIEIVGRRSLIYKLENDFYSKESVSIMQSSDSVYDKGYHNPDLIDAVVKIIVAVVGTGGVSLIITEYIKSKQINIEYDEINKRIVLQNVSYKKAKDFFDYIIARMNSTEE